MTKQELESGKEILNELYNNLLQFDKLMKKLPTGLVDTNFTDVADDAHFLIGWFSGALYTTSQKSD